MHISGRTFQVARCNLARCQHQHPRASLPHLPVGGFPIAMARAIAMASGSDRPPSHEHGQPFDPSAEAARRGLARAAAETDLWPSLDRYNPDAEYPWGGPIPITTPGQGPPDPSDPTQWASGRRGEFLLRGPLQQCPTAAAGVQTAPAAGDPRPAPSSTRTSRSASRAQPFPARSSTRMHTTSRKQISQSSIADGVQALTGVFVEAMVEACSLVPRGREEVLCGSGFSECGVIVSHQMTRRFGDLCQSLSPVFGDNPCIPATADSLHKWLLHAYWLRLVVPIALGQARDRMQELMDTLQTSSPDWIRGISMTYQFFLAALDMALHSCQHPRFLDELPILDLTVNDIRDNVHVTIVGHQASRIVEFRASAPPR